jgi:heme/copper-type cytochrome/quinol oxidase subunit 2
MEMTSYVSPALREQLSEPREIHNSVIKLTLLSIILLGVAVVALYFAWKIQNASPTGAKIDKSVWLLLGVAGAGVFFFLLRALPKWLTLGSPVLIISREGLAFREKPIMRWEDITENEWVSLGSMGITTGAALRVRTADRKVKREAITFNCSAAEYARLCELYENASVEDQRNR